MFGPKSLLWCPHEEHAAAAARSGEQTCWPRCSAVLPVRSTATTVCGAAASSKRAASRWPPFTAASRGVLRSAAPVPTACGAASSRTTIADVWPPAAASSNGELPTSSRVAALPGTAASRVLTVAACPPAAAACSGVWCRLVISEVLPGTAASKHCTTAVCPAAAAACRAVQPLLSRCSTAAGSPSSVSNSWTRGRRPRPAAARSRAGPGESSRPALIREQAQRATTVKYKKQVVRHSMTGAADIVPRPGPEAMQRHTALGPSPLPAGTAAAQRFSCCTSSGWATLCHMPPSSAPRLICRPAALHR